MANVPEIPTPPTGAVFCAPLSTLRSTIDCAACGKAIPIIQGWRICQGCYQAGIIWAAKMAREKFLLDREAVMANAKLVEAIDPQELMDR